MKITKRVRVNMRVPKELIEWAKLYAKERNTTLTQDYIDFLTQKKDWVSISLKTFDKQDNKDPTSDFGSKSEKNE